MGRTLPDDGVSKMLGENVKIPLGKPKTSNFKETEQYCCILLYNEYIVYDITQVKPRYLVKVKFNFRY